MVQDLILAPGLGTIAGDGQRTIYNVGMCKCHSFYTTFLVC